MYMCLPWISNVRSILREFIRPLLPVVILGDLVSSMFLPEAVLALHSVDVVSEVVGVIGVVIVLLYHGDQHGGLTATLVVRTTSIRNKTISIIIQN